VTHTWYGQDTPEFPAITPAGYVRIAIRGAVLGTLVFGCLGLLLLVRLFERPMFGVRRPVTPYITQFVCRNAFRVLGMGFRSRGQLMQTQGAVVSNHCSWLDIFALNARKRIYFVAKADVANWPGIGWLARATGTVFIERDRRRAREQTDLFHERLTAGHKLLFFPEGTSTDGLRVLPFKTTLFAALFAENLKQVSFVQPVTLNYIAPSGEDARFYGWWGNMEFGPHLLHTLAAARQGQVEVVYHTPLKVAEFQDRKSLAIACENAVRGGLRAST